MDKKAEKRVKKSLKTPGGEFEKIGKNGGFSASFFEICKS
jgi:hypothetical protein